LSGLALLWGRPESSRAKGGERADPGEGRSPDPPCRRRSSGSGQALGNHRRQFIPYLFRLRRSRPLPLFFRLSGRTGNGFFWTVCLLLALTFPGHGSLCRGRPALWCSVGASKSFLGRSLLGHGPLWLSRRAFLLYGGVAVTGRLAIIYLVILADTSFHYRTRLSQNRGHNWQTDTLIHMSRPSLRSGLPALWPLIGGFILATSLFLSSCPESYIAFSRIRIRHWKEESRAVSRFRRLRKPPPVLSANQPG